LFIPSRGGATSGVLVVLLEKLLLFKKPSSFSFLGGSSAGISPAAHASRTAFTKASTPGRIGIKFGSSSWSQALLRSLIVTNPTPLSQRSQECHKRAQKSLFGQDLQHVLGGNFGTCLFDTTVSPNR